MFITHKINILRIEKHTKIVFLYDLYHIFMFPEIQLKKYYFYPQTSKMGGCSYAESDSGNKIASSPPRAGFLAMTIDLIICGLTRDTGLTYLHRHCDPAQREMQSLIWRALWIINS
jgi:hypothetical protein